MIVVTAAIIEKDGKYLICQRAEDDALSLGWEFPGGKLEDGETPEECLVREIQEELAMEVMIDRHFCDTVYCSERGELLLKSYLVIIRRGTPQLLEHHDMAWVTAAELLTYDLLPADVEIAEKLQAAAR